MRRITSSLPARWRSSAGPSRCRPTRPISSPTPTRSIATGSVVFTSGSSRIAADRLEYNTVTKTGTFYNAFGTATLQEQKKKRGVAAPVQQASLYGGQEPDVYFYGEKVSKIGPEKYRLTKGGFTTCVQPTPRWRLTSGTVVLNLDHYAMLTNALFKVKGMPVLYLPIMYYPINKEDRASGFLMPCTGVPRSAGRR